MRLLASRLPFLDHCHWLSNRQCIAETRRPCQVGYVFCMATLAAYNALHDEDFDLREECLSLGKGPVNGFDVYRDQNLRKASN